MTNHSHPDRRVEQLAGELLDLVPSPVSAVAELTLNEKDELADALVVDALLRESAARERGLSAGRTERILTGLRGAGSPARLRLVPGAPRRSSRWLAGGLATAAALAFFLMLMTPAPANLAHAALARSIAAAREPIDRQYALRIELVPRMLGERVIVGEVSVRGEARFVSHVRGADATRAIELSMGFDGQELWMSPPTALLRGLALRRLMALDDAEQERPRELLDIGRALQRLRTFEYWVELLPDEPLAEQGGAPATCLRATYHGGAPLRPRRVEIWADPQTGVIWKLVEAWPEDSVGPFRRVELIYQGAVPQDDSIYERPE